MSTLGHYAYLHRRAIVVVALLLAAAAAAYGSTVFDQARPFGFDDPDSESSRAYELLEDATGEQAVPGVIVVVQPAMADPATRRIAVGRAAGDLAGIVGIARVIRPQGAASPLVSADGEISLILGQLDREVDDQAKVGERVDAVFADRQGVTVGGTAVAAVQLNETTVEDLRRIELYAAPFLLLISLLVFRSLVAALLPILVGGLSIAFTLAALRALTELIVIDIFALQVVTVLGLGLAIDYSLFMVSRYREELARSGPGGQALRDTTVPVGRMVCFSAVTVAAAVAALAIFPQRFLYSTGIGCALVALLSAAVVTLVLPSVLALLGERVDSLSPGRLQRPATRSRRWQSVARVVLSRPVIVSVAVAGAMVLAALPFLRVELTRADARVLPQDDSANVVDQTIRGRFADDPGAALLVVVPAGSAKQPGVATGRRLLASLAGVEKVSRPQPIQGVTVIRAQIEPEVYSDQALDLVGAAREIRWPPGVLLTGASAELVDQRASLREHLPLAVGIILATTFAILLVMTGSVVLPLLTILANTLTIGVSLGVLVLIFQDARLEDLLLYEGIGALDISVPILLFAVIFGLSTDYGVFLLSRVGEARREGASDGTAIAVGLERTGSIITAAALLFAVAMGSFVFSQMIFIKEVAVGTSVAVLVDAALVRTLLLPALMQICGRATWWAPGPLQRWAGLRA